MTPASRTHFRWTFAGQAMARIVGLPDIRELHAETPGWPQGVAIESLQFADALIKALEESEPKECAHHWRWHEDESTFGDSYHQCSKCGVREESEPKECEHDWYQANDDGAPPYSRCRKCDVVE